MTAAQSRPKLRLVVGGLAIVAAAALVACGPSGGGGGDEGGGTTIIQNKGSDTMVNVAQVWAEEYGAVEPGVEVEVSGGGSGVGIAALIRGAVDIANASRDMKPQEMESARSHDGHSSVSRSRAFRTTPSSGSVGSPAPGRTSSSATTSSRSGTLPSARGT
jgi:ABC-type phosphate transport system substrate-binding protein